jgi:hypothetical protein
MEHPTPPEHKPIPLKPPPADPVDALLFLLACLLTAVALLLGFFMFALFET